MSARRRRAEDFEKWVADRIRQHPVRIQVEAAAIEPIALTERLRELHCQLLAFEADLADGSINGLRNIVQRFACDILIAR